MDSALTPVASSTQSHERHAFVPCARRNWPPRTRWVYVWPVFEHRIDVSWGECDIAGLVYFPRMLDWCHRALEALFNELPGGYAHFTGPRRMGIPTVRLVGDFLAPIRYGERCVVHVRVRRIGRSSVTFEHTITGESDRTLRAKFEHVVAVCTLDGPAAVDVPEDVRALLAPHAE